MPDERLKKTLDSYNVIWTSPSENAGESMPCGGGDVGLNVWVENGDLLIYLSRSGTFDELNRMPKLGRLRVTLSPNPFDATESFRQELHLYDGFVRIIASSNGLEASIDVWVDVKRPVVHVEVSSDHPTTCVAAYENWRPEKREFSKAEQPSARSWSGAPKPGFIQPDLVEFDGNAVRFVHRNAGRNAFDLCVEQQGLATIRDQLWNPLDGLAFGGKMTGDNMVAVGKRDGVYASTPFTGWRLRSRQQSTTHSVRVSLHVDQTKSLDEWVAGVTELQSEAWNDPFARENTLSFWHAFWERSHIFLDIDEPDPTSQRWQVARNYQLFRYQLGCNATGKWPTKFNGGFFTYDPEFVDPKKTLDPDFRNWGGGTFTAQNQRLLYWPMLKSGDVDMMTPAFEFYRNNLRNAEARAKHYWNIEGACFTEQIECFGLPVAYEYGWKRPNDLEAGVEHNNWVNYQWDTVFEFCLMILDARRFAAIEIANYLPLIESCLSFYDAFYREHSARKTGQPLDEHGKLRICPGTACETYKDALNPSSTVAALRAVLERLLELPDELLPRRERWQTMLATIPAIPFRDKDGYSTIAPAVSWSRKQNCELPQLYPVFPYGAFGVGKPELDVAINTWNHGADASDQKQIQSWHQDAIFCARLGLTEEAASLTIEKLKDAPRRFPTFWGPGHDWVPDHNWGGSGMIGLQEMLLQCVGEKLYLLPAWPRDWDVDFKLHAPGQTTIECTFKNGKVDRLVVTPPERERDVVLPR
jgi:hypothetical protein